MKSTTKYYDFEIFTSLKIEYSSNCWTSFGKKKYDDGDLQPQDIEWKPTSTTDNNFHLTRFISFQIIIIPYHPTESSKKSREKSDCSISLIHTLYSVTKWSEYFLSVPDYRK